MRVSWYFVVPDDDCQAKNGKTVQKKKSNNRTKYWVESWHRRGGKLSGRRVCFQVVLGRLDFDRLHGVLGIVALAGLGRLVLLVVEKIIFAGARYAGAALVLFAASWRCDLD